MSSIDFWEYPAEIVRPPSSDFYSSFILGIGKSWKNGIAV